jgi:hypothetical protein
MKRAKAQINQWKIKLNLVLANKIIYALGRKAIEKGRQHQERKYV